MSKETVTIPVDLMKETLSLISELAYVHEQFYRTPDDGGEERMAWLIEVEDKLKSALKEKHE